MGTTTSNKEINSGIIDIVKHRGWYVAISLALLIPGLFFMVYATVNSPERFPIRLGIDFIGGTLLEYGFEKPVQQSDLPAIREIFESTGATGPVVQIQQNRQIEAVKPLEGPEQPASTSIKASNEPLGVGPATKQVQTVVSIRSKPLSDNQIAQIQQGLRQNYGAYTLLQKNSIGPTLASELLSNGLIALLCAYLLIVGYLTFRFQLDYALCAIIALVHDTIFVFSVFSMLGVLFHTEVDSLFITGILTVVGFSVHDTIVVFDRLRENTKLLYSKKLPFGTIANISVNQTLARSINTSLTAILTLTALFFFGGSTTRDFVLVMLLGIIVGTFSSIFVASLLLAWWRERHDPNAVAPTKSVSSPVTA